MQEPRKGLWEMIMVAMVRMMMLLVGADATEQVYDDGDGDGDEDEDAGGDDN